MNPMAPSKLAVQATSPTSGLKGQVVVVTGAAQGLGLAVAQAAAYAGAATVVLVDRDVTKGRAAAAKLSSNPALTARPFEAIFLECDLAFPDAISRLVQEIDSRYGQIDALVNAAGDTRRGGLDDTSVELWDSLIAVNLRAPFLLTQAVSSVMVRNGRGGSIVNVASVQARGGLTFCMAYATAKGGLLTLTKNNAAALGRHGIKVNAINMGWCSTENEHLLQVRQCGDENWLLAADKVSYLGRICRPEDVARAALFLITDAHATGSVLELHPEHIEGLLGGGIGKA